MNKILLIDGTNNFLRNYAAVPSLTLNGESNGGVSGTLKSLGYFARICKPDEIIVVWDGEGGSKKRRAVIKDYKNKRTPTRLNRNYEFELTDIDKNKIIQRIRLDEYIKDLPILQITISDIEADDVIAYLCNSIFNKNNKIIVSTDKDYYQLLNKNTIIFSPTKKQFITTKSVVEEYKIYPYNFGLVKAIVGDKSDNLKGIKGIGFKNIIKYFPFITEEKKVELNQLFEFCEKKKKKYKKYNKFLLNKKVIIDNLYCMTLTETTIISFHSMQKIKENLKNKGLCFNATSFRLKLIEDGIKMSDDFFQNFKILSMKE